MTGEPVVEVRAAVKEYRRGVTTIRAVDDVSLAVERREIVAVTGPSGSGKSTLLHLIGGLDVPTSGGVRVAGYDLAALDDPGLTRFRREQLGFVFQFFNLLPTMSAWENVALPCLLGGQRLRSLRPRAVALLERVGLADRVDHRPAELSGGQLQRVALARALMADPVLLLGDEPTGNLDSASGSEVLGLLRDVAADGTAVIVVTHDREVAAVADRVLRLVDGRLDDRP